MATKKNSSTRTTTRTTSKRKTKKQIQEEKTIKNNIIIGIVFLFLSVFLFVALSFNVLGSIGTVIGNYLRGTTGSISILIPLYLLLFSVIVLKNRQEKFPMLPFVLGLIIIFLIMIMNSARFISADNTYLDAKEFFDKGVNLEGGGLFGTGFAMFLAKYLGKAGLYALSIILLILCGFILARNTPILNYWNKIVLKSQDARIALNERIEKNEENRAIRREQKAKMDEKKIVLDDFRERQKERRKLHKEERGGGRSSLSLEEISLFSGGTKNTTEFDYSNADNETIVQTLRNEPKEPIRHDGKYGLDPLHKASPGIGLDGLDPSEYDSRSDGLVVDKPKADRGSEVKSTPDVSKPASKPATEVKPRTTLEPKPVISPVRKEIDSESEFSIDEKEFTKVKKTGKYKKPPVDLLIEYSNNKNTLDQSEVNRKMLLLEETLKSFNVDAKVINASQGSAVTRYEVQPNVGVKVSKIVNLADDIALNMRAKSIRIEAPIPGKAAVGIEIENEHVNMVSFRELIESNEFKKSKSKISFVVGRDISGNAIVADLKEMPHLLIAGSTGSGKSVCINGIINSILYKSDPSEVRLIMIDPKQVELGDYNGIPHLLVPVVTDPNKAAGALSWAVAEMTKRYKLFADSHVRDLEGYNEYLISNGQKNEVLPQIVIIIDELADLMMVAPSQVEDAINRIAQLARAAGMHLVVATQRPSVDVLTGTIKNNIPSRIALTVASQFDSRTILDMNGAEKLVGKGDMLYSPMGMGKPIRVQGCYIDNKEIHRVIDYVKNQQDAEYSEDVIERINSGNVKGSAQEKDDLYDEAVAFVISAGKASTSLIQRRFRIGYNRAANIIDQMEAEGIIGPADGAKPRQILVADVPEESEIVEPQPEEEVYIEESVEDSPQIDDEPSEEEPIVYERYEDYQEYQEDEPVNSDIQDLFDDLDEMSEN